MRPIDPDERVLIVGCFINGSLGAALGAFVGGLAGAQVGLILGLLLAGLPAVTNKIWFWLRQPDGMTRFVSVQIGATAIAVAQTIADIVASLIGPIIGVLRGPALLVCIAARAIAGTSAGLLDQLWRIVATPLGMANVAALGVVAFNLAKPDFAGPVVFLGLGLLILALLVTESEARDEEAERNSGRER